MNEDFRNKILTVADKSIDIMGDYIEGKIEGSDRIVYAERMLRSGIKIEHMNQLKSQSDRSFGLRLLQFLPKDREIREKYIALTNPEIKDILLLDSPEKDKKPKAT